MEPGLGSVEAQLWVRTTVVLHPGWASRGQFRSDTGLAFPALGEGRCTEGASGWGCCVGGGCLVEEKGRGAGIGMRKAQDVLVCGEEVFQRRGEVSCWGGVARSGPSAGSGGHRKGSGSWSRLCLPLPLQWRHTPGWDRGGDRPLRGGVWGVWVLSPEGHPQGTHCPPGEQSTAPQGTTGGP